MTTTRFSSYGAPSTPGSFQRNPNTPESQKKYTSTPPSKTAAVSTNTTGRIRETSQAAIRLLCPLVRCEDNDLCYRFLLDAETGSHFLFSFKRVAGREGADGCARSVSESIAGSNYN